MDFHVLIWWSCLFGLWDLNYPSCGRHCAKIWSRLEDWPYDMIDPGRWIGWWLWLSILEMPCFNGLEGLEAYHFSRLLWSDTRRLRSTVAVTLVLNYSIVWITRVNSQSLNSSRNSWGNTKLKIASFQLTRLKQHQNAYIVVHLIRKATKAFQFPGITRQRFVPGTSGTLDELGWMGPNLASERLGSYHLGHSVELSTRNTVAPSDGHHTIARDFTYPSSPMPPHGMDPLGVVLTISILWRGGWDAHKYLSSHLLDGCFFTPIRINPITSHNNQFTTYNTFSKQQLQTAKMVAAVAPNAVPK